MYCKVLRQLRQASQSASAIKESTTTKEVMANQVINELKNKVEYTVVITRAEDT